MLHYKTREYREALCIGLTSFKADMDSATPDQPAKAADKSMIPYNIIWMQKLY